MPKGEYRRTGKSIEHCRTVNIGREPWNKGKKGLQVAWNKGKKNWMSEDGKKRMIESKKDKKLTAEHREKLSVAVKGERHYNWKGGKTKVNLRIRNSIELRLWREAVLARDNWTCQICGQIGGILEIHHIKSFSKFVNLRTSISNGVTYCKKCHRNLHKKTYVV